MSKKDLLQLERRARKQGWQVHRTKGGHTKWISPIDGEVIPGPSTPSDYRGGKNHMQKLKAHGYQVSPSPVRKSATRVIVEKYLESHEGQVLSTVEISEATGIAVKTVYNTLFQLRNRTEMFRPCRGKWVWKPASANQGTQSASLPPPVFASEPPVVNSEPVENAVEPPLEIEADSPSEEPPNEEAEFPEIERARNLLTRSAIQDIVAIAKVNSNGQEPILPEIHTLPDTLVGREPLVVVPSAVPSDAPALFEAITVHSSGKLVLRDQNGDIWLATLMIPKEK